MKPLNLDILDIKKQVAKFSIPEVTSTFIKETGSVEFDKEGLFSETIFGEITSNDRFVKFGRIDLKINIIHPRIWKVLMSLKRFYLDIINRKSFAIFDKTEQNFIKAEEDQLGAGTGYTFFMKHFRDLKFKETKSATRTDKIKLMNLYPNRDRLLSKVWLVSPAGMREYDESAGAMGMEDINKLYLTLINYVAAMPDKHTDNPMYDSVKFSIQRKVNEIYDYLFGLLDGKKGFLQSKFASRAVALGTRNVISSTDTTALSPDDSQALKSDESKIPLYQAAKSLQPVVVHQLNDVFFSFIFNQTHNKAGLIDTNDYSLKYVELTDTDKNQFLSSDGVDKFINNYGNESIRKDPVTFKLQSGEEYYLYLIYDNGDEIFMIRDIKAFEEYMKTGDTVDKSTLVNSDVEYEKPWTKDKIVSEYGEKFANHLLKDEAHRWRVDTGIELIHKEPTVKEFIRISKNWYSMTDHQKKVSDKKSLELFGITNEEHMDDLIAYYTAKNQFKESKLRPMTYMEMLYIATFEAAKGKHAFITRYPVTGIESIYPSKMHIITTSNSRKITLKAMYNNNTHVDYPEYPNLKEKSLDSVQIHPMRLAGLGAD